MADNQTSTVSTNKLHSIIDIVNNNFDSPILSGSVALVILAAKYLNIKIDSGNSEFNFGNVDFIINVDPCDFLIKTNIVMNKYHSFENNSINIAKFTNGTYIINIYNLRVQPLFEIINNIRVIKSKCLYNEYVFYDNNVDDIRYQYKLNVLTQINRIKSN
jgi:hypothetical protein